MDMIDFMALCSDVETDDGKTETMSPWPRFMQDEIWADRVKFRRMLKEGMGKYRDLYETHGAAFVEWWMGLAPAERKRVFQMPNEELRVQFSTVFDFKTAYQVVMCSVLEQVTKFGDTGYKADGATDCEIFLEEHLRFTKGAWVVAEELYSSDEGCDMFFGMLMQLGGSHLLPVRSRALRKKSADAKRAAEAAGGAGARAGSREEDDEEDNAEDEAGDESKSAKPETGSQSFRADRRLVRLLIFRYYADMAWNRFKRFNVSQTRQHAATVEQRAVVEAKGE
jgi:hypothetical protein